MGSVNKAILVGNLGRDAEVTTTSAGSRSARFTLATTTRRKDNKSGTWEDRTEWHRIVLLGKQAESLRDYLKKGKQIYVEGRIETRSWDDKDGQKRYMTEIIADRVQLLGSPGGGGRPSGPRGDYGGQEPDDLSQAPSPGPDDDDIRVLTLRARHRYAVPSRPSSNPSLGEQAESLQGLCLVGAIGRDDHLAAPVPRRGAAAP